jgi:hypothetical protein
MSSKQHYTDELQKLQSDPEHYMTPGARKYFRRVALGYAVLAVAVCAGIFSLTTRVDHKLRHDLNQLGVKGCLASIPTYKKFNSTIQVQINAQKDALQLNLGRGDVERAAINRKAIKDLQNSKLKVPTKESCSKKIV